MYHSFFIHSSADGHLGCYYIQCCNEYWGARVSFNSGLLSVYAQQWDCWVIWQVSFQFFKEYPQLWVLLAVYKLQILHTHTHMHTHVCVQSIITLYILHIYTLYIWEGVKVTQSCPTLWTVAHQAPLSMELSRYEYRSGLPFLYPGDLPDPEIQPGSPEL